MAKECLFLAYLPVKFETTKLPKMTALCDFGNILNSIRMMFDTGQRV